MYNPEHQREIAKRIAHDVPNIDLMLPTWARRKNPIVARELGEYWRIFLPEARPLMLWIMGYVVLLVITLIFPSLTLMVMLPFLVGFLVFPFMIYQYGMNLWFILQETADSMAREYENNTIDLIRMTPYSTREIILSKIAAGVWRRMDVMSFLLLFTAALGIPIIITIYINAYPPERYPVLAHAMSLIALISYMIRIPFEMAMVSAIGVLMGTAVRTRQNAITASVFLVAFYFILLNMLRFINADWMMRLMLDAFVPLVLPIGITAFCIQQAVRSLKER
jgi:ABC-type transport system involved in multi-copper enzyme maturation permease subunit